MSSDLGIPRGKTVRSQWWRVDVAPNGNIFDLSEMGGPTHGAMTRHRLESLFVVVSEALGRGIPDDLRKTVTNDLRA